MANRIRNRRALRVPQVLDAENGVADDSKLDPAPKKSKRKTSTTTPTVRKPRAKKQPPRFCEHWCIFDNGMKQAALFNYNQRGQAEEKLVAIQSSKKSLHWLQIVKLPMPAPEVESLLAAAEVVAQV
jgi:hypothetical protein